MKRLFALVLALIMVLSVSALANDAVDYQQHLANKASFETMEEAKVNGPVEMSELTGKAYIADPCMAAYPTGTTFVYRSAGYYTCLSAAFRMNTTILVYTDKAFASKDEAFAYLDDMGLINIIDEIYGSVVLVTPVNAASGFGSSDQYAYYLLQEAMMNLGGSGRVDGVSYSYMDNSYYGGLTYRYLIGIDGGADFLCDYVATSLDYIGRVAAMLLINPDMHKALNVATYVPVYMANPSETAFEKFQTVNGAYNYEDTAIKTVYYNAQFPLRKVVVSKESADDLYGIVSDAYYTLLVKNMRTPTVQSNFYTAATEYSSYKWNQSPYALSERNAIFDGVTADGIYVIEHQDETLAAYTAANGEYMRTWYEFLPEEVLNNTAPEHSIPLILCNHGAGDDPIQAVDELNMLTLAGKERVALVAERHTTDVPGNSLFGATPFDTIGEALPALVQYMLDTYPALDPSRVYATGYSMGGAATIWAAEAAPELFAAVVPMAAGTLSGIYAPTEEEAAAFTDYDLPMLLLTSEFDGASAIDQTNHTIGSGYKEVFKRFLAFNEMGDIEYDFEAYPFVGVAYDKIVRTTLNDAYENITWYFYNDEGIPMMAINYTELQPHGLNPEYGDIAWEYLKHFSRDQETGEITYNPYAK